MKKRASVVVLVLSLALGLAAPLRAEAGKPPAPNGLQERYVRSAAMIPGESSLVAAVYTVDVDGTEISDVTGRAAWSSSDPTAFTVGDKGRQNGVVSASPGAPSGTTALITATFKTHSVSFPVTIQ